MTVKPPKFLKSKYFVMEPDNWHMTDDAPEELKKELSIFLKTLRNGVKEKG